MAATGANAATFSFAGTFAQDDNVQLFNFETESESDVTLRTYSFAGGTQADGNVVSPGGFDPILSLFDSTGALIANNDDDMDGGSVDPVTGVAYDSFLTTALAPGNYTVALTQYDNFASGTDLSDGFLYDG